MMQPKDFFGAPVRIETARLVLDRHCLADFEDLAAMWAEPEVQRFVPVGADRSGSWMRLLRYGGFWPMFGYGYWAVRHKESGRYAGDVGFGQLFREIEPSIDGLARRRLGVFRLGTRPRHRQRSPASGARLAGRTRPPEKRVHHRSEQHRLVTPGRQARLHRPQNRKIPRRRYGAAQQEIAGGGVRKARGRRPLDHRGGHGCGSSRTCGPPR